MQWSVAVAVVGIEYERVAIRNVWILHNIDRVSNRQHVVVANGVFPRIEFDKIPIDVLVSAS
jgi:hypothetical protein